MSSMSSSAVLLSEEQSLREKSNHDRARQGLVISISSATGIHKREIKALLDQLGSMQRHDFNFNGYIKRGFGATDGRSQPKRAAELWNFLRGLRDSGEKLAIHLKFSPIPSRLAQVPENEQAEIRAALAKGEKLAYSQLRHFLFKVEPRPAAGDPSTRYDVQEDLKD